MDITWFGLSCFRIRSRALTVIADPYDNSLGLTLPRLKAHVVTVSHHATGHDNTRGVRSPDHIFEGPGEYEVNGIFIQGVPVYHKGPVGERERSTAFVYHFPDLVVAHLGDIGALPTREQTELLSEADVLLLPVGGSHTLDAAKAVEIITELEPRVVIPMHYAQPGLNLELDPVDKFFKEMGVPAPDPIDTLKITKKDLSGEETEVILLNPQGTSES